MCIKSDLATCVNIIHSELFCILFIFPPHLRSYCTSRVENLSDEPELGLLGMMVVKMRFLCTEDRLTMLRMIHELMVTLYFILFFYPHPPSKLKSFQTLKWQWARVCYFTLSDLAVLFRVSGWFHFHAQGRWGHRRRRPAVIYSQGVCKCVWDGLVQPHQQRETVFPLPWY